MKKNVILITDYAAPYEGNFIASIKELEKVSKSKNYDIKFLFPKRATNIEWLKNFSLKYNVEFFDEGILNIINILNKSMDKSSENIIYSHFARHKTQLAIKMFRMSHKKVKLIQHFHNHCKIPKKFPKKQFMKLAYKLYEGDLNIGCSKSVMDSMPYKKKKNTFVDNAIDFSRLDGSIASNIIKKNKDEFVILMFGFDYYRKGVDLAIEAIKDIADDKKIILAISLASNREKIENIIKTQLGEFPEWIKLLPPSENVSEYYGMSDIFLSAAREEGFCYSLVEATYCSKRCISSKIGGVPIDIPGIITFESENTEDLKNKILFAMENDNDKINEAKEYIMNKYELNKWANDIVEKLEFQIEKNAIVLTGTINPKVFFEEGEGVYLIDENMRLKQYEQRICQYILDTEFDDIVFIENSGYQFDFKKYEKIASENFKRFEFISLKPNVDKIIELGKSYGEAELIDYAMENSRLLKEHNIVYKITGRIFLKNWKKILHTKYNRKNEFISINKAKWCKTDFFKVYKNDYLKYIDGIGKYCNEKEGIDLEKVYYNCLKNSEIEVDSFNVYPKLEGIYGTTGQRYNKPIWKMILFNILIKFKFFNIK